MLQANDAQAVLRDGHVQLHAAAHALCAAGGGGAAGGRAAQVRDRFEAASRQKKLFTASGRDFRSVSERQRARSALNSADRALA